MYYIIITIRIIILVVKGLNIYFVLLLLSKFLLLLLKNITVKVFTTTSLRNIFNYFDYLLFNRNLY